MIVSEPAIPDGIITDIADAITATIGGQYFIDILANSSPRSHSRLIRREMKTESMMKISVSEITACTAIVIAIDVMRGGGEELWGKPGRGNS